MIRVQLEKLGDQSRTGYRAADVDQLVDLVAELDEHLSEGGEAPEDWCADEDEDGPDED